MKYLGVLLKPGKLNTNDCDILINKVTQRTRSWVPEG